MRLQGTISASILSSTSGGGSPTPPNGNGEKITFSGLNSVGRVGSGYTTTISVPAGYSCNWFMYEAETRSIFANGSTTSLSTSFTSSSRMLAYDIAVFAVKGTLAFVRYLRRAVTVLPAIPTEGSANIVIDCANGGVTYRNNNFVDRTGQVVYVKGDYNSGAGYLGLEAWVSSDPYNPCQFYFANASINSTGPYCMRINQNCRNVLFDGCGGAEGTYGMKLTMPGSGTRAQILYVEASTNSGSNPNNAGRGITICGFDEDGMLISSAGLKVDTANSSTVNYDAYLTTGNGGALFNLRMFNIRIQNTVDEGLYCGYVDDLLHSGFAHAPIVGVRIYKFKTNHTGGDGMQMGASMFDGEVHDCVVTDPGYRNDNNHKNGMQFSSGNRNCFVYRNWVVGNNLFSMFTGRGGGNNEFFSNVFINPITSNNVNIFIVIYPNDYFTTLSYKIYNNTLVTSNNSEPVEVWNLNVDPQPANQPKMNPFVFADNLLVFNTVNQYKRVNNPDQTGWVIGNYGTNNINAPMFVDGPGRDYHLSSLSSPAFQARHSFTKGHFLSNYDYEGVQFVNDVHGAFSGYELMT